MSSRESIQVNDKTGPDIWSRDLDRDEEREEGLLESREMRMLWWILGSLAER